MSGHRGLDHKGVERECIQEIHFCDMPARWPTVVIDPPWHYDDKLRARKRGAENHYRTMPLEGIRALDVGTWASPDAHLYVWATNAFVIEAKTLIARWGFRYITALTWCKPQMGMGRYYRNSTEHALFAVRGKLPPLRRDAPTWFQAPRLRHSQKPDAFYDLVESVSPGPYLDVFARRHRMGWDVAGDQVYSAIPELAAV